MDKNFVLDNFNIVLEKKYFVRADGRGTRLFQSFTLDNIFFGQFVFCPGQKSFFPADGRGKKACQNLHVPETLKSAHAFYLKLNC